MLILQQWFKIQLQSVLYHLKIQYSCSVICPTYTVVLKDDLWSLNFVLLSSISHNGLSFLHPSLGDQPPGGLWDEPASVFNTKTDMSRISEVAFKNNTLDTNNTSDTFIQKIK